MITTKDFVFNIESDKPSYNLVFERNVKRTYLAFT